MFRRTALVVCGVAIALCVPAVLPLVGVSAIAAEEGNNPFDVPPAEAAPNPADENPFGAPDSESAPAAENPFADPAPAKRATETPQARPTAKPAAREPGEDLAARAEAKIRQTLELPTRMEFVEMPLQDAMNYLKDYHGIEIQLDNQALEDAGIGADTPVTRQINGLPLRAGLSLLLSEYDMTYVVRDGVLLITTQQKAGSMTELRVYNVHESVGESASAEAVAELLATLSGACQAGSSKSGGGQLQIVPFENLLVVRASQQDHAELESLFAKIKDKLASE